MIKGYQNDKSYSGPELRSRADRGANSSPGISHIESVKRSTPPKTISPLIEDEDEKTTRDNASNEDRWASRFLNSQA